MTRTRTRLLALPVLTVAAVTALAGCASHSSASSSDALPKLSALGNPSEKVTITWLDEANVNVNVGSTIKAFEAEYPNIHVKYESVPYADFDTVLASRLKTGKVDVITVDQPETARYAAAGYLSDLTSVFSSESDRVDSASLASSTVDGKLYTAPEQSDSSFLFYNKSLLSAAGVAAPSSDPSKPSTWEQITTDAKKAQAAGATDGITWERIASWYYQWPLAQGLGGGAGATGAGNLTPQLDSAAAKKAFGWYASLYADGVSPQGDADSTYTNLFAAGKSAFHVGGDWDLSTFNAEKDLDYGVAPLPEFADGKASSNAGGVALGLYSGSTEKQAALTLINAFVFKGSGAVAYNKETSSPPANDEGKAVFWEQSQFADERAAGIREIVEYQLAHGVAKARVASVGYDELSSALSSALLDITNGEDPDDALASAQRTARNALKKYR